MYTNYSSLSVNYLKSFFRKEHVSAAYTTQYNNFIDYRQAFDSVWQGGLWVVLRNYGIPEKLMSLLEDSKSISAVRVDKELTERFRVTAAV